MNDQVYPVHGGMEDWAYAASWDPERVVPCEPKTYGGYSTEKTKYDDSTLRCYNMLVETSRRKIPIDGLGTSEQLLYLKPRHNGHITRNARLAIMALELVEPYVRFHAVDNLNLSDDMIPLSPHTCQNIVAAPKPDFQVSWSVGGALSVDESEVYVLSNWDERLSPLCNGQPQNATALMAALTAGVSGPVSGKRNDVFQSSVDLSSFKQGTTVAVIARSRVDQSWLQGSPKAHIVHARRDPNYRFSSPSGDILQGRLDWFSQPLLINIGSSSTTTAEQQIRYDATKVPVESPKEEWDSGEIYPSSPTNSSRPTHHPMQLLLIACVCLIVILLYRRGFDRFVRKSRMERIRDFIEDEDAVSPGLVEIKGHELT